MGVGLNAPKQDMATLIHSARAKSSHGRLIRIIVSDRKLSEYSPDVNFWTARGWTGECILTVGALHENDAEHITDVVKDLELQHSPTCESLDTFQESFADGSVRFVVSRTSRHRIILALAAAIAGFIYAPLLLLFGVFVFTVSSRVKESLTVLPAAGVQLESVREVYLFGRKILTWGNPSFLPRDTILDCTMLEAIRGWNVVDYAAILTSAAGKRENINIIFPTILPPLSIAVHVFRLMDAALKDELRWRRPFIALCGIGSGAHAALQMEAAHPGMFSSVTTICDDAITYNGLCPLFVACSPGSLCAQAARAIPVPYIEASMDEDSREFILKAEADWLADLRASPQG